ncbi:MAG: gamma-glutamylcyclotransferase [Gammaproteobacteria bacterium]|nr:gamma-glutamylcyclotransferase [Gammaproteobacteria bacterium]MDH3373173.1 gamma-glutamylcyclotransferase [Gammaproteobacteria bacterium]MDH3551431.1 gamma-glutamylcyclotransferase [Gammaproteobacteria bacterium]
MDVVHYAAYGSNLHPRRLRARTASARLVGTGYLPGWSLRFHKRSADTSGKCSILKGSSGVYVAVYQMSPADKHILDGIEGVGCGYVDASIVVPGMGECATYIAADSHVDNALEPFDWYREIVLLGCKELGFPAAYARRIEQVTAATDPDPNRRQNGWNTVDKLRESLAVRVN